MVHNEEHQPHQTADFHKVTINAKEVKFARIQLCIST